MAKDSKDDNNRVPVRERQHGRMRAVQCIYGCDVLVSWNEGAVEEFFGRGDKNAFGKGLAMGVVEKREVIDRLLSECCSNGDILKTGQVERAVLRVAAYELITQSEPVPVIINEALVVTKKLTVEHSVAFINAVLDRLKDKITY